ncbi:hypothetical protein BDV33DRAFT_204906 [Aspergillus novoparasiticus]|uniref:Uncharacterized protein n=1 Tax=Aspergillus novoparasiticus TaxID=986946 RepID=A0A5N6ER14_9EURO|nr:hypothetical protein BDV33DRAFT_204906 [Aspergillus novoparasiticus]
MLRAGVSEEATNDMMRGYTGDKKDDLTLERDRQGAVWANRCMSALVENGWGHKRDFGGFMAHPHCRPHRLPSSPGRETRTLRKTYAAPAPVELSSAATSSGRVTKEIRQIIRHLQRTIEEQTTFIQATPTKLKRVKHGQNGLQTQNEKLREEVEALREELTFAQMWAMTSLLLLACMQISKTAPKCDHRG